MKEKDTKKRDRSPFEEACNGPIMVSIDDLIKSRPGAKAEPKAEPSPKSDKQRKGCRAPRQDACHETDEDLFFFVAVSKTLPPKPNTEPEPEPESAEDEND